MGVVFLRGEDAAEGGLNAEGGEDSGSEAGGIDSLGSGAAGEFKACSVKAAHRGKRGGRVGVGGELAHCDANARALANMVSQNNQAVRIVEWERAEEDAFDERED